MSQDLNFPFILFRVLGKILFVLSKYQFLYLHKEGHSQPFLERTQLHSILTLMGASVVGRIMVPQRYPRLHPQNLCVCTLHDKNNFIDAPKDFAMKILFRVIQRDPT